MTPNVEEAERAQADLCPSVLRIQIRPIIIISLDPDPYQKYG